MTVTNLDDIRKKTVSCSLCEKPMDLAYKPFCSKRCADVDLNRWFGENYIMPTQEYEIANDYSEEESEY